MHDGKLDLAAANGVGVSVLLGNGDGAFQPAVTYAAGTYTESIAGGAFNGDGNPALAVTNPGSSGIVSVLLGNGDGTFQAAVNYNVGTYPYSVAVGDFNGDGKPNLVVTNNTSSTADSVSVLLGNGDGTFQPALNSAAGTDLLSVAVGDFSGDGILIWRWRAIRAAN